MVRAAVTGDHPDLDLAVLEQIQERVLWLATRIVDYANHDRPNRDGIKVGGHQASSASMVTIMTALWFAHMRRGDRISVKPHASPVLHAVHYLLGNLEADYLRRLRAFGGLQAYPSRTKDPFPVDFSTGSVGLGAVAPLFAAAVRRYVDAHFDAREASRFIALLGDAELDEGNVWEAIAEPATAGLGNVLWVVDLNRQSLDRVVPGIRAARWERMFAENGWHVVEVKYGARLTALFERDGGAALRRRIDDMPNEEYQSLFSYSGAEFRKRLLAGADAEAEAAVRHLDDTELAGAVRNLGGHDLAALLDGFRQADAVTDRPTVVFAYTIKGWGLPIAGNPLNHSMLLTREQIDAFRSRAGLTAADEWDRFAPDSDAGRLCAATARRLGSGDAAGSARAPVAVPEQLDLRVRKPLSTQEAFGRLLTRLSRLPEVAPRVVTASPDVATSTNLAGWINRVGVFAPEHRSSWDADEGPLRWSEHPGGQHLELGISEMNLFLLLGQLGQAAELHGEPLLPIGTVYDPFVLRGLDAFVYSLYAGARFVVVGTPSGITLAPEGGAHQSTITPSVGLELPSVTFAEPAYAGALDWLLCDGLRRLGDSDGESLYLRLTTRPLDQAPFEAARERLGDERLRDDVLAGGYVLRDAGAGGPLVQLAASGAVLPEVLAAADELEAEGVAARVLDVTSLDRLHRGWREALRGGVRHARAVADDHQIGRLLAADRAAPIVTVHDAASHAMSWLGSVHGAPVVSLGVDAFGQSGAIGDVYDANDLAAGAIVNAALLALDRCDPGRRGQAGGPDGGSAR